MEGLTFPLKRGCLRVCRTLKWHATVHYIVYCTWGESYSTRGPSTLGGELFKLPPSWFLGIFPRLLALFQMLETGGLQGTRGRPACRAGCLEGAGRQR